MMPPPPAPEDLVRGVLDALEMPTCAVDSAGVILFVNRAWTLAGHSPRDASDPPNYLELCDAVPPDRPDFTEAQSLACGLRAVLSGELERHQSEYSAPDPPGYRRYDVRITPASFGATAGAAIMHVDITDAHHERQQLDHQVLHDALTGLPASRAALTRIGDSL